MWDQQSLRSVCAYAQSDQRSKGQTVSFSESSHVAYQIKAGDAGSNMVANTLATDTPATPGVGSKGQTNISSWDINLLNISC